jgi:hypothetical protein
MQIQLRRLGRRFGAASGVLVLAAALLAAAASPATAAPAAGPKCSTYGYNHWGQDAASSECSGRAGRTFRHRAEIYCANNIEGVYQWRYGPWVTVGERSRATCAVYEYRLGHRLGEKGR